jgi:hypothetical protein
VELRVYPIFCNYTADCLKKYYNCFETKDFPL